MWRSCLVAPVFLFLLCCVVFVFLLWECESSIPRQSHPTSFIWPGQPTFHVVLHPPRLAGTLVRGRNGAKPCGVNLGRFSSVTSFIYIYIYVDVLQSYISKRMEKVENLRRTETRSYTTSSPQEILPPSKPTYQMVCGLRLWSIAGQS